MCIPCSPVKRNEITTLHQGTAKLPEYAYFYCCNLNAAGVTAWRCIRPNKVPCLLITRKYPYFYAFAFENDGQCIIVNSVYGARWLQYLSPDNVAGY